MQGEIIGGFRLSPQQKRLWLLQEAASDQAFYSHGVVSIKGESKPELLKAAIRQVFARHEILRTTFCRVPGMSIPLQVINEVCDPVISEYDQSQLSQDSQDLQFEAIVRQLNQEAFLFERGQLFRLSLVSLSPGERALVVVAPPLCLDAGGLRNFVRELSRCYELLLSGGQLQDGPVQYADVAEWLNECLEADDASVAQDYWRNQELLDNIALELPLNARACGARSFNPQTVCISIDPETTSAVEAVGLKYEASTETFLWACWQALLHRLSGQLKIVVGTAFDGRNYAELEETIGPLAKYLPVGCQFEEGAKFCDILIQAQETIHTAGEWQEWFDWEEIPRLNGSYGHPPFYPLGFDFNQPVEAYFGGGVSFSIRNQSARFDRFDLRLALGFSESAIRGTLEYNADLYDADEMRRLAAQFETLVEHAAATPHAHVRELRILSQFDRLRLLSFNDGFTPYPKDKCVHQLFEEQVARTPDKIAVVYGDHRLTYQEVNHRANHLASYLRIIGVGPDQPVAICTERNAEMVAGLLGILKAGGAYVPLDPTYPKERLEFMLKDSGAGVLLTQERFAKSLSVDEARVVSIDSDLERIVQSGRENPGNTANPENLAYVIYTSGSTGAPKGVMISHRGLVNYLSWCAKAYRVAEGCGSPVHSSIGFDLTITSLFSPLMVGASVTLLEQSEGVEILKSALLDGAPYSLIKLTPAHLKLLGHELTGEAVAIKTKTFVIGGEQLSAEVTGLWQRLASETDLFNEYGPTETVVGCCVYRVGQGEHPRAAIPIGKPIANTQIYLLAPDLEPALFAITGEIYIGGEGVARGYLNRPDLTADKFIPDPFNLEPGARLYRTGDLAHYLPDGNVEFLGRMDHQVKIRGFRIELEEIEAALKLHPAIQDAVALFTEQTTGDQRLVAYLAPDPQRAFALRHLLRLRGKDSPADLPQYELPNGMLIFHKNRGETDYLYKEIFEDQLYLRHGITLSDGDCIFDVGANIGMFSLFAGQICAKSAIFAFEPIPPTFEVLRANAALHGLNIKLFQCGVSSESGVATFTSYPFLSLMSGRFAGGVEERDVVKLFEMNRRAAGAGRTAGWDEDLIDETLDEWMASERFNCPVKTISEVISEHGIEKIDLLKIDAEKSELDVLNGIHEQDWPKIKQLIIEVHDLDGRLDQVKALLERRNYRLAVQQESFLSETALYLIYAVRLPGGQAPISLNGSGSAGREKTWSSEGRLISDVKQFLEEKLPSYMIPSSWALLESIPLTHNGKVDRKALSALCASGLRPERSFSAPRNPVEELVAEIWSELLNLDRIGRDDNFFDLGGHSLIATRIVSRLRKVFRIDVQLRHLFDRPTVAGLADRIKEMMASGFALEACPIIPIPRDGELPLSFAQQRLWFLDQLEPGNPAYNIPVGVRLKGPLNIAALERTVTEIVRRHEILRTTISIIDGRPRQVISPPRKLGLPMIDLAGLPEEGRGAEAGRLAAEEGRGPFDMSLGPLFRVTLIHMGPDHHIALFTMHHIISDGWSMEILVREVAALYDAYSNNRPSPLTELTIQYADFANWQRQWFEGEVLESQLAYWREKLGDSPAGFELPADRPRPPDQSFRGDSLSFALPDDLALALRDLSRREGGTLFMVLLSALQTLLYRYTGQHDISVGVPIAGRNHIETERLIGFFVNTLVLRSQLSGGLTFRETLEQARDVVLEAHIHQDLPFEKLVDELQPERNLSRTPLFQVMFNFDSVRQEQLPWQSLELSAVEIESRTAKFDLTLSVVDDGRAITGFFKYKTDLYDASTIERLRNHFQTLLQGVVADPGQKLSSLPVLTERERHQLSREWNLTAREYDLDNCLHLAFEEQAGRSPDTVAVQFEEEFLTYRELNERANRLGHYLRSLGAGPETFVGISMERSLTMIVGVLGILKAGGAYVPLDHNLPKERKAFIIEDARMPLILTLQSLAEDLSDQPLRIVCLDSDEELIARQSPDQAPVQVNADNPAYVIYTSGSTGKPKGVVIAHRQVLNYVCAMRERLDLVSGASYAMVQPLSVDSCKTVIYPPLFTGGCLHVISQERAADPGYLSEYLHRHAIDCLKIAPSHLMALQSSGQERLMPRHWLIIGGEASRRKWGEKLAQLSPDCRVFNHYGPTETTVGVLTYDLKRGKSDRFSSTLPIGRPLANTQAYLLDRYFEPAPVGVSGELHIGGQCLARGYLNRADLTAAVFIPDPFGQEPGARLYRTGDLARYFPDGNVEFLGRLDHQVKIRGFRIELGEIESALAGHPAVREVIVQAREREGHHRRLAAYLSFVDGAGPSVGELQSFLGGKLPDYMVPQVFITLDQLPRTAHGKIDLRALPEPEQTGPESTRDFVAPRSDNEKVLAEIWSKVLGVEKVGAHDNFFELGGDSILSIQIIARAAQAGLRLTPKQLFQRQTIAKLASVAVAGAPIKAEQGLVVGDTPLTPIQLRFLEQDSPDLNHWNHAFLLEVKEGVEPAHLKTAIQQLVRRHDALRLRLQREGPDWRQMIVGDEVASFLEIDGSSWPESEQGAAITAEATRLQTSLNLSEGPLLRAVFFKLGDHRSGRLLVIIHHLAVDGVSWRILLEDLDTAYGQIRDGRAVVLPPKTSSFKQWAESLIAYTRSQTLQSELGYWLAESREKAAALPVDFTGGQNTVASEQAVLASLSVEETTALLQDVPRAYRTQVNEALLTALAQSFARCHGSRSLLVDLEGHGREDLFDDLDVSRTVGWFTSVFPVLLELGDKADPGESLKLVKEQLRKIPHHGIGYGLLRYLSEDRKSAEAWKNFPQPEVSFNYLGQLDQTVAESPTFRPAREPVGPTRSRGARRNYLLEVTGAVYGRQLQMAWVYSEAIHRRSTIETLANAFIDSLRSLIEHCRSEKAGGFTPSDFPLIHLDQDALNKAFDEIEF